MSNLENKFTNLSKGEALEINTINYQKTLSTSSTSESSNNKSLFPTLLYSGVFCFIAAPFISNLLIPVGTATVIGAFLYENNN